MRWLNNEQMSAAEKNMLEYCETHQVSMDNLIKFRDVILDSCLSHRCMNHRHIPTDNYEASGAECMVCAIDGERHTRAAAQIEGVRLLEENEKIKELRESREAEMVRLIQLLQGWIVWWDGDDQMDTDPPDEATRDLFTSNSE